jgi:hypothetical protein
VYSELLQRISKKMKKAVAIILIVCFAVVTIVGILQRIMVGPAIDRIPIAFLCSARLWNPGADQHRESRGSDGTLPIRFHSSALCSIRRSVRKAQFMAKRNNAVGS